MREELERAWAALDQLPDCVLEQLDTKFWTDLLNLIWVKSSCLNDVLHDEPSMIVLDDAGRGWRCVVHSNDDPTWRGIRDVGSVAYRCD